MVSRSHADCEPWVFATGRRECLDHIVVMGEKHVRHHLANYATYHIAARGRHLALDKDAPLYRPAQKVGRITSVPWLGGLHHQYIRMANRRASGQDFQQPQAGGSACAEDGGAGDARPIKETPYH
jgi:hypothetical protein